MGWGNTHPFIEEDTMSKDAKEEVGPTCLYKDGESETFEGDEVAEALEAGWKDEPTPKKKKDKDKK